MRSVLQLFAGRVTHRRNAVAVARQTLRWLGTDDGAAMKVPLDSPTNESWGSNLRGLGHNNYLGKILNARVYEACIETPLQRATVLSAALDNEIYLKREDLQPVFSFKLRGAYNKIAHLTSE